MILAEAPIRKVRLLEDRALVTRVMDFEMKPGRNNIRVEKVSPVMADKTLSVRLKQESGITVLESRVLRSVRPESEHSEEELQALADQVRDLKDLLDSHSSQLQVLEGLESAASFDLENWLRSAAQDVHWGRGGQESWQEELELLSGRASELSSQRLEILDRYEETKSKCEKLGQQLAEKRSPSTEVEASLQLSFESQESKKTSVEIEYVVPSACWRPCYLARWNGSRLEMEMQASVWQNTGVDWTGVELNLSTQRQALGTSPPTLSRDILRLKKKQKQVVMQAREESVTVKHQTSSQVPGIDDGGEVLTLSATRVCDIKSDGRPHRVPLSHFGSALRPERLVLAELSQCVLLNSKQTNESELPLLPGPVDLVKSSGLVGRTFLEHTSPGEEFVLSWGSEPAVSVHRSVTEGKEETSVMSSWITVSHGVKISLRNQTTESQDFTVRERIPVSELKEVKIVEHPKKTTENKKADSNGFVEWSVRLEAQEQRVIELFYDVQKKKKVVER